MLGSHYWRMALKRHADQIEKLQEPNDWTEKLGARIEMLVSVACFMVRRLNEHGFLPEDLVTQDVPLRSCKVDPDEEPPENGFYRPNQLGRWRYWGNWEDRFITVINQVIHNDYFVPVMTREGALDSILYFGSPREPRNEYEMADRMFDGEPPTYLKHIDIEKLVSLLREAAEAEDPD